MPTIHRRLQDARATYAKVLEIDPRHSVALGFLGMVYHLLEDVDRAIIKYHEVLILIICLYIHVLTLSLGTQH
jgi:anaphase-promoting complex subunit 6